MRGFESPPGLTSLKIGMDIHFILGIASAVLVLGCGLPYIYDILFGTTRPNRVTWFGWLLLGSTAFLIQLTNHPDYSIFFVGTDVAVEATILCLAFYRGVTQFSALDGACLALGLLGFFLWIGLDQPVLALVASLAADL